MHATCVAEGAIQRLGETPSDSTRRRLNRVEWCSKDVAHCIAHAYVPDEAIWLPGEQMRQHILKTEFRVPSRHEVLASAHHHGVNPTGIPWHDYPPAAPALTLSAATDPTARRTRERYDHDADSSDDDGHPEKRARPSASSSSLQ